MDEMFASTQSASSAAMHPVRRKSHQRTTANNMTHDGGKIPDGGARVRTSNPMCRQHKPPQAAADRIRFILP
jgi:hypothetical protein